MMITTNVSNVPDNWSNYFTLLVNSYAPSTTVAKPWYKPNELVHVHVPKPVQHETVIEVTAKNNNDHKLHVNMPCFNLHKPYGIATTKQLASPFEDDDRPDWHRFNSKNRKPMMFEEVIDENGNSHGPHGTINVRPIEPTIDTSEEIDEEVTL